MPGLITFGLTSLPALIVGLSATGETRDGRDGGHGSAMAGIVISGLQVAGWVLFWGLYMAGSAWTSCWS
ncbi:DUF4190 domain-containing protein [Pseudonocardia sediminis]